nr:hypothetical protein [Tanacetum cinerariifolium]
DRQMQIVGGNGGNQFRQYSRQNAGNPAGNGNLVAARAEGNAAVQNKNQIRCYNCRGKEEAGIQLQAEEYDLMAAAADLDKIKEVNTNCILMANLQQALTSGTQTDSALVYDTDGSAKNDNDVISEDTSVEQGVFVPQMTISKEELYLSNVSNMVTVSKTISIPNEDLSDDTTPSVARKFLNEVKSSLVTLQHVVKQKMTLEVHNWSSSAHKEVHKIISHEITPIINQVDARVQNFEIQFLQEAVKFVRDFKSLTKKADESLDKQKSLEPEFERLLKANVSHDIMSIVQNSLVDVPSDLRIELDRTKEKLELCIIKKEKEYAVLWNNWYTKCEE